MPKGRRCAGPESSAVMPAQLPHAPARQPWCHVQFDDPAATGPERPPTASRRRKPWTGQPTPKPRAGQAFAAMTRPKGLVCGARWTTEPAWRDLSMASQLSTVVGRQREERRPTGALLHPVTSARRLCQPSSRCSGSSGPISIGASRSATARRSAGGASSFQGVPAPPSDG